MRPTSKISGEAREDVAVVAPHPGHQKRRRKVAMGLSLQDKRDVFEQFLLVYREALIAQKRVVLDDFVRLTRAHRTYASWLFNHPISKYPFCSSTPKELQYGGLKGTCVGLEPDESGMYGKAIISLAL